MAARIKISIQKLVAEIERAKAEVEARHATALADFPKVLEEWRRECLAKLDKARERVETGQCPNTATYEANKVTLPIRPEPPLLNVARHERDIRTLSMAAEDTILLGADDYNRYLS